MRSILSLFFAVPISFTVSFFITHQMPGHFLDDESQVTTMSSAYFQQDFLSTFVAYFKGDWGYSWMYPDRTVFSFVQEAFTFTLTFQIFAVLLMIFSSMSISYLMITYKRFRIFAEKILYLGTTLPLLFILPILIYILSFHYPLLPLRYDESYKSYLLPLVGLILRPLCFSSQILFSKWSESLHQDYFRTAIAKGLSFNQALWKHGFKNSALSYVSQIVQLTGQILTGSVLIETLFSLPGLGFLFVESLKNRDLPILTGLVFVFCCLYLLTQFFLELAFRYFEPRSKL